MLLDIVKVSEVYVNSLSACIADVPFPVNIEFDAKLVAPVPPFVTGTVSDNVEPAAVIVISLEPSNDTPLIFLAVSKAVAVPALPVNDPIKPSAVILPVEGL